MHEFGADNGRSQVNGAGNMLLGFISYYAPIQCAAQGDVDFAIVLALGFGAVAGWARLWNAVGAQRFVANHEGLTLTSGLESRRVPWTHVLAVETWHHLNWLDYATVHYLDAGELRVASCWEQFARDKLLTFVRSCAEGVAADAERTTLQRASLLDRVIWLGLLKRLACDMLGAIFVGYLFGSIGEACLLGLLAASLSALIASTRYPVCNRLLLQRDGRWWRLGANEAAPLRSPPRSLSLWIRSREIATRGGQQIARENVSS